MKKKTQVFIVLPIGLVLAGIVVGTYFFDPSFISDLYRLTSMIIATLWAFFIVPAVLLAITMGTRYFLSKSPQEAFRDGVLIGVLGFGGLFALCLLVSPVAGMVWYVFAIREAIAEEKEKKAERSRKDDDIFDL